MTGNIQYNNVGNPGDILKHGALIALARMMQVRHADQSVAYLDTHAFVPEAPIAYTQWEDDLAALCKRYPGYSLYRHIEAPYVQKGSYLCSVGLAHRSLPGARYFLSEADDATRAGLWRQLAAQGVSPQRLPKEASEWAAAADLPETAAFLGLIDPFELDEGQWQTAMSAVHAIWCQGTPGLLEVFAYKTGKEHASWYAPPAGWIGPVATLDIEPYHLAVYATPEMAGPVSQVLEPLGWVGADSAL